ncbi:MAG: endonuclease III [Acidimicrobiia bacterium]
MGPRTPKGRAREVFRRLSIEFPGTAQELCELDHDGPFQLLVATILSAQTTDARVNTVTPEVFRRWPDPAALAAAPAAELEAVLHPTGFFRQKAKSLLGTAVALLERHQGQVPTRMADLVALPGVGRKTANVIRSVGFGLPGLPVDTHVLRLTHRLGLTTETDPVKVELEVGALLPGRDHGLFSERLILHGRRVCFARKPACGGCVLADLCPSAFTF